MSGPASLVIRAVTEDADLEVLAGIVNATTPEDPTTLDEIAISSHRHTATGMDAAHA